MKDKKKGPSTRKQNGPKRMTKVKRQLNAKKLKIENQELLFKFDKDHTGITFGDAGAIMCFVQWLEEKNYRILNEEDVVCVPVKYLVEPSKLK